MGARKMSYSALKNNNDTRLDEALSISTPSPSQRGTNRKSMTPNDIRIDDGLSDALEDNSGNPSAVVIPDFSDGMERPTMSFEERELSDKETLARKEGYEKGYNEREKRNQETGRKDI